MLPKKGEYLQIQEKIFSLHQFDVDWMGIRKRIGCTELIWSHQRSSGVTTSVS